MRCACTWGRLWWPCHHYGWPLSISSSARIPVLGSRLEWISLDFQDHSLFRVFRNKKGVKHCHKVIKLQLHYHMPGVWNSILKRHRSCPQEARGLMGDPDAFSRNCPLGKLVWIRIPDSEAYKRVFWLSLWRPTKQGILEKWYLWWHQNNKVWINKEKKQNIKAGVITLPKSQKWKYTAFDWNVSDKQRTKTDPINQEAVNCSIRADNK
jgi:hypothetical protein